MKTFARFYIQLQSGLYRQFYISWTNAGKGKICFTIAFVSCSLFLFKCGICRKLRRRYEMSYSIVEHQLNIASFIYHYTPPILLALWCNFYFCSKKEQKKVELYTTLPDENYTHSCHILIPFAVNWIFGTNANIV